MARSKPSAIVIRGGDLPGYGAEADEVWSIDEDVLEQLLNEDGVDLPVIDVGMAHGEKARGGALF